MSIMILLLTIGIMFNNNIRCIEILILIQTQLHDNAFNNNIRCIEINYLQYRYMYLYRLITT